MQIHDKNFKPYINKDELQKIITITADNINNKYKSHVNTENPLIILGILNGAFMFLSDLVKKIHVPCEVHFMKVTSYEGTESTGVIQNIIGINRSLENLQILIVEDIIDTGLTIRNIVNTLEKKQPKCIDICTLFFKKDKYDENSNVDSKQININFIGKIIPDKFVVGYGLDYNNVGRNLDEIYSL